TIMKNQTPSTRSIDPVRNSLNRSLWRCSLLSIPLALACFAFLPAARAQDCRDGCDAGLANTFLGINALMSATGSANTGLGENTLDYTAGSDNTATGNDALTFNGDGEKNTATGTEA